MDRQMAADLDRHITGNYGEDSVPTEPRYPDIHVQLTGEDGNAFMVLGLVRRALRRAQVPAGEIEAFTEEAKSGDYDRLLQTAMRWVDVS